MIHAFCGRKWSPGICGAVFVVQCGADVRTLGVPAPQNSEGQIYSPQFKDTGILVKCTHLLLISIVLINVTVIDEQLIQTHAKYSYILKPYHWQRNI